jgi:hypothetical protein
MAEDLTSRWSILFGTQGLEERLDLATQYAYFWWDDGRSEEYSEQKLKEKIEAEGRAGDDPYVKAYNRLTSRD